MKKLIILISVLTLVLFASCTDEKEPASTPDNLGGDVILDDVYDTRFDQTVEEAVACYFSLLTEDGFGNYIMAFPEDFRKGYQADLGYDDKTFDEAINNATELLHAGLDEKYAGAQYIIEYEHRGEEELTGAERDQLVHDIVEYCHMNEGVIEKVVNHTYLVSEYGYDEINDAVVNYEDYEEVLTMLYVTGEGWVVSPNEFQLP